MGGGLCGESLWPQALLRTDIDLRISGLCEDAMAQKQVRVCVLYVVLRVLARAGRGRMLTGFAAGDPRLPRNTVGCRNALCIVCAARCPRCGWRCGWSCECALALRVHGMLFVL